MKLIVAMIQPHRLPDVKEALFNAQVYRMTVTNALGAGQQGGLKRPIVVSSIPSIFSRK